MTDEKRRTDGFTPTPHRACARCAPSERSRARLVSGFTLIEMTVVIAVLGLLATAMIPSSRKGERQVALAKEQALIVGALIRAKSLSIQKFQDRGQTICGWGVHFEIQTPPLRSRYLIFKDLLTGSECTDANGSDRRYTDFNEEVAGLSFQLDARVKFVALPIPGIPDIVFVPPEQFVYLGGCSPSWPDPPDPPVGCSRPAPSRVTIELKTINDNFSSSIEVNKAGRINPF